ncbi:sialic acid-binding Ig-like lectin 14 [Perca fluviatilis]|uniref:sialic acid-binding Ig-like lectin 14 n=1 Tax=Perca fluviatilis TaxID=8168 RepID=UPI0019623CF8|nr:sialic acid-binding Ig-like lectin 14 [Perca fluviatilis]
MARPVLNGTCPVKPLSSEFFAMRCHVELPVTSMRVCINGWEQNSVIKDCCISLSEGEIRAEAGLCVVIPCSFTTSYYFTPQHIVWYKCEPSKPNYADSDIIFHTNKNNNKTQSGFKGRVSLLEPDVSRRNCSIIVNDLTESDSGSYQLRVNGLLYWNTDGFTFSPRTTVSVKGLTQKPTVVIPPLTEGQQSTLSCTAPGLCSGSVPEISWTWRGAGEKDSHITGNITAFRTENLTAVTQRHSSTLTFISSAEHHGTTVSCKVSFTNNITTEETVTLNVTYVKEVTVTGNPSVKEGETDSELQC